MPRKKKAVLEEPEEVVTSGETPEDSSTKPEPIDPGKRTSKINTWRPGPKTTIVERDGKIFVVNFDKVFNSKVHPHKNRVYQLEKIVLTVLKLLHDAASFNGCFHIVYTEDMGSM